jgi:hypothetical protein
MNDENRGDLDSGTWERVDGTRPRVNRLKVPGGWLASVFGGFSYPVAFYRWEVVK